MLAMEKQCLLCSVGVVEEEAVVLETARCSLSDRGITEVLAAVLGKSIISSGRKKLTNYDHYKVLFMPPSPSCGYHKTSPKFIGFQEHHIWNSLS